MKTELKIDSDCTEPKVIIVTDKITDEINRIMEMLSSEASNLLVGFKDNTAEIIEPDCILRFYTGGGKVYAVTNKGEYALRLRLYQIEERMSFDKFVRISNSEIINLRQVSGFDLSLVGTICVTMKDGTITYVSRRYVSKIKNKLGI